MTNDEKHLGANAAAAAIARSAFAKEYRQATPGPWFVGPHYKGDVESRQGRVCECQPFSSPRAEANARLIATAPDYHVSAYRLAMHVLQSEMYRTDPDAKMFVDDVLAIHAKAEGR